MIASGGPSKPAPDPQSTPANPVGGLETWGIESGRAADVFSPSELSRGLTFAGFFWMLAIAAILGHRAYAPLLLLPLAVIDWRHAYYARRATFRRLDRGWLLYFASAAVICFYTVLSALWSPLPQRADWGLRLSLCFALAPFAYHAVSYLSPAARARAAAGMAWASLAMLALLLFEAATNAGIRRFLPPDQHISRDIISLGRGSLLLVLLVWPARRIFHMQLRRPLIGLALIVLAAIPAVRFTIVTNAVMLGTGAVGLVWGFLFKARGVALLFAGAVALVWLTPLVAILMPTDTVLVWAQDLPDSWVQRIHIWDRAGAEILTHPFGGGVGYSRSLTDAMEMVTINGVKLNTMPLHPHNLFLHVWLDLGVIGALGLSGLIIAAYLGARGAVAGGGAGVICAIAASLLVTAMTEWSVWQIWRFAAVWIALIAWRLSGPSMR
ncbi:MAG: O-antigen ligase family protein [Pseudomonadota bacterium]